MIIAEWTAPHEIAGTLELTRDPYRYGIGPYDDIHGCTWDIRSVVCWQGNRYVNARQASDVLGCYREWLPYRVEIVNP